MTTPTKPTLDSLLADSELFDQWLAQHQDEVVGIPDKTRDCPIARYLTEKMGMPCHVSYDVCVSHNPETNRLESTARLPDWAYQVASRIDNRHANPVHGSQVRSILQEVISNS